MRNLITVLLLFFATPALAQFWTHYANARFGYELDIPPGFEGHGESDNGDGQGFYRIEAEQGLTVWGGHLSGSLMDETGNGVTQASAQNWGISAQTSTPQWASFSGQRDHRIFHQRLIALCDGESYAAFRLEYNIRDLASVTPVVEGLVRSFVPVGC